MTPCTRKCGVNPTESPVVLTIHDCDVKAEFFAVGLTVLFVRDWKLPPIGRTYYTTATSPFTAKTHNHYCTKCNVRTRTPTYFFSIAITKKNPSTCCQAETTGDTDSDCLLFCTCTYFGSCKQNSVHFALLPFCCSSCWCQREKRGER